MLFHSECYRPEGFFKENYVKMTYDLQNVGEKNKSQRIGSKYQFKSRKGSKLFEKDVGTTQLRKGTL